MNEERPPADQSDEPEAPPAEPPSDASGATAEAIAAESVEELVDELEPIAEAAAAADAREVDTAFSEDLDPETLAFGAPKPQAIVCQWCNGPLDSDDLEVCPHCGSRLKPADGDLVVPGVTTLSSDAARALELAEIQRNREAAKSGQAMYTTPSLASTAAIVPAPDEATVEAANRPPDEEVRRLMLQMELEARQARATASARADIEDMIVADAEHEASADAQPEASADAEPEAAAEAGRRHADPDTDVGRAANQRFQAPTRPASVGRLRRRGGTGLGRVTRLPTPGPSFAPGVGSRRARRVGDRSAGRHGHHRDRRRLVAGAPLCVRFGRDHRHAVHRAEVRAPARAPVDGHRTRLRRRACRAHRRGGRAAPGPSQAPSGRR
jgi:hypothetical protein